MSDRDDNRQASHSEMITAYVSMLVALGAAMFIVYEVVWGWSV